MAVSATTAALVGLATTVVSTGVQIYSGFAQASAQAEQMQAASRQAAFQAQQATIQSEQYTMQAQQTRIQQEMALTQAKAEAAEARDEQTRLHAKQVAQAAASGYQLDSQSFMSVLTATASRAKLDQAQILRNGKYNAAVLGVSAAAQDMSAVSKKIDANILRDSSSRYNSTSKSTYGPAWLNAGSAILGGANSAMVYANDLGWFDTKSKEKKKYEEPKVYTV